jgi:hypothetical protein
MNTKKLLLQITTLCITILYFISANAQTNEYNYSIKNRWTIKASISRYRTYQEYPVLAHVGGDFFDPAQSRKMVNFKVEANYGITKFIEIGLFTGFQHYEWQGTTDLIVMDSLINKSFAPLFGVTVNFHILPFFIKSKNCNWDLYLTAKYGGCYLPHKEVESPYFQHSKYRHEYGLGLGIGYYIKNIIGFYAECSVGQFTLFQSPRILTLQDWKFLKWKTDGAESNFSFRIGITAKIIQKSRR